MLNFTAPMLLNHPGLRVKAETDNSFLRFLRTFVPVWLACHRSILASP
jgi:hypothetical protein